MKTTSNWSGRQDLNLPKRGITTLILLIFILATASLPPQCNAEYKFADNWTWQDTAWQGAFVAVAAGDWLQTRYIAKHPDEYYETNKALGKHPSTSEVDAYFAGCVLGHTLISLALPPKLTWNGEIVTVFDVPVNPRRIWQGIWIGVEAGYVIHNASIGVKFNW
jgi:hypothetical protein